LAPPAFSGLIGLIDRYVVELIVGCSWMIDEVTRMLLDMTR
jgi:hypothetical protein